MITIETFSLAFPHKICFENFSTTVEDGERITVIGKNGSGKSTFLKMIAETNANVGYVPQMIEDFNTLSGGERFNRALSRVLYTHPNTLLLDEPTNHLDTANRKSLLRMLKDYDGTLIIATHDEEILRKIVDKIWHIEGGKIHTFYGKYDDYMAKVRIQRESIIQEMETLNTQKKSMHEALMKEQERIAKSKASGKKKVANRKWTKSVGDLKAMKAEKSQGSKLKSIDAKKQELVEQLENLKLPEIIVPKFSISVQDIGRKMLVSIRQASVAYGDVVILKNINLSLMAGERIAIEGNNGSGKTTLIKAILNHPSLIKTGNWDAIPPEQIGYLDQFYSTLDPQKTALQIIPDRKLLSRFLFRKNEEVNNKVQNMSGGEKARLSLALIAFHTPKLLVLDEITNNIDRETREHVTQILKEYPGAMIVIAHNRQFLDDIAVNKYYTV
ncbi:MAG: ATP-binding cassette domain-containing protein [Puniceicoccales bacterium]|jgi:ATPase subunit of ABC transporter with duplicated ATPase domains|nr:ATP-binding cassette domain-containing protein [Puniceicoccales bacterium]